MESAEALFESLFPALLVVAGMSILGLWLAWSLRIGWLRGTLAALCRAGWVIPLFVAFYPETTTEQLPRTMALKPLHVLIDDSESMRQGGQGAPSATAERLLEVIEENCVRFGCLPRVVRLSEQDGETRAGYTPLSAVLESWLFKVGQEPWLLVTDGGDYRPTVDWDPNLRGLGLAEEGAFGVSATEGEPGLPMPRAMIVGFEERGEANVWIETAGVPPFSFEDKPLNLDVALARLERQKEQAERIQLQVLVEDKPVATLNAEFAPGETKTGVTVTIPPLPRGQHLLTLRALPTARESSLWDNTLHAQVEVMPNTVGVLHLLGSPSWDGRFLRRYLKSEPKYDLISFFILRDPWDSQQVNERELSLIPFPVERLFREELPNFRVVVIQNFTLFQFLLPEFQNNLVKFVKDGGGLLFIGGPRALQSADLGSSPLREILPFKVDEAVATSPRIFSPFLRQDLGSEVDETGPYYDPALEFQVELARPDGHKRALANVYDDWEQLGQALTGWKTARGLHHMENVELKPDFTTPLLLAKTQAGKKIPLAVASYPGKGRALWLFTDSMWRLGMTVDDDASRQVYNRFMHAAMTWLMRQDLKKPLVAKTFQLTGDLKRAARWRVTLQGPAARYFRASKDWTLKVCGVVQDPEALKVVKAGPDEWEVSGPLAARFSGGERCQLTVEGTHEAFGSVSASITTVFPEVFKDSEIGAAPQKLERLAKLTGAKLTLPPEDPEDAVVAWMSEASGRYGVSLPSRFRTVRNFFWILERPWFWLLMALLPLEVLIRRLDKLVGRRASRRLTDKAQPEAI